MTGADKDSGAITFISHFRVKPGHQEAFRELWSSVSAGLEEAKPATAGYLGYLSEDGGTLTIVHVFPDADAMAAHFEGADERAAAAYEHIMPAGWEIYGRPLAASLAEIQGASAATGASLTLHPDGLGGFLRTTLG
jgi:quinol monooxygenase YgiN